MRTPRRQGFTLLELLIVVAMIMLLAGLVVTVARQVYISRLEAATRVYMEVIQTALQGYHLEYQEYPFETDPPTQQGRTVSAAADELVAKDKLTKKQAEDNRNDAWGQPMLYLLFNYKQTPYPVVSYVNYSGVPNGNWTTRINPLIASGALDWQSSHPVIGSPGADGVFGTSSDGTSDDIYNVKSD